MGGVVRPLERLYPRGEDFTGNEARGIRLDRAYRMRAQLKLNMETHDSE